MSSESPDQLPRNMRPAVRLHRLEATGALLSCVTCAAATAVAVVLNPCFSR